MVQHQQVDRRLAKSMRSRPTDAEQKLWSIVRAGRIAGLKFKRQVPLDGYVLDFVCFERKLIVEADGGQHAESERDRRRDEHFAKSGFKTLRFWNTDILTNPDG
ncbi:MAG TPA: endonuclease domain-containing protein, partial [Devosia sp.]